eukprot:4429176-Alexandrium_andersonii.AAC.1
MRTRLWPQQALRAQRESGASGAKRGASGARYRHLRVLGLLRFQGPGKAVSSPRLVGAAASLKAPTALCSQ